MPPQLLPASAAAFAPRASSVNVVLGSKVEPWLTQTLKRINRVKRPLNSVPQHQRCLTETLSSENAIWTLTSLMVAKAPETELRQDPNPLVEALFNYQLITVEAYIVHVDMVLRNEVAFKLTPDSIEALIEYHKDVHTVDNKANTFDWPEKDQQAKKMHNDFVQAINKFVYRTHVTALEGLEEDGAGELLYGKSDEVKTNILALFKSLQPPPPKPVEVFRQPPLLPSNAGAAANLSSLWTQQSLAAAAHPANAMAAAIAATAAAITSTLSAPVDAWRVLPSSPNISATSVESTNTIWANMSMQEMQHDMHNDMHNDMHHQHQQHQQQQQQMHHLTPSPPMHYSQPYSTAALYYGPSPVVTAPMSHLSLPSMLTPQQCGVSVGYGGFGWDRYQEYTTMI